MLALLEITRQIVVPVSHVPDDRRRAVIRLDGPQFRHGSVRAIYPAKDLRTVQASEGDSQDQTIAIILGSSGSGLLEYRITGPDLPRGSLEIERGQGFITPAAHRIPHIGGERLQAA